MFTRVVELTTKPGKARELCATINDKVLPILRSQNGFQDEIVLVSDTHPDNVLAISFWQNKPDADRYQREGFPRINELLRQYFAQDPDVRTFQLDTSTVHNIGAGKAA
jgi:quinol monooxygenase YgiN